MYADSFHRTLDSALAHHGAGSSHHFHPDQEVIMSNAPLRPGPITDAAEFDCAIDPGVDTLSVHEFDITDGRIQIIVVNRGGHDVSVVLTEGQRADLIKALGGRL